MSELALDPRKFKDWQIAEVAERSMKTFAQVGAELGLKEDELIPYGHYLGKVDYPKVIERIRARPQGKYIDVTAINPTPLGEGISGGDTLTP